MLRGNHECRQMTIFHNFRQETISKYNQELYNMIMEAFDNLPLASIINGKILAVHGGISPEIDQILELNSIQRNKEPPQNGLICDILWSDPVDNDHGIQNGAYVYNSSRGCSNYYGFCK